MNFKSRSLRELADMVCGNVDFFTYRSSSRITEFFEDCGLPYTHDGSTRWAWVADRICEVLAMPAPPGNLPREFVRMLRELMDREDVINDDAERSGALAVLNATLKREGFAAFYDERNVLQVRDTEARIVSTDASSPHRPLTKEEARTRRLLAAYLDRCSEDDLIAEVLLPLFRQLGFHRITAAGHADKALEYGKDIWMKFVIPTTHVLYFGVQVKRGKIDASGASTANIAEIHNQVNMMLGHEIFDPEIGKRVLVDHAFIIAGGEVTKQARNWLGQRLDATKRSQILFMDRNDLLDLFVTVKLPLPADALPPAPPPSMLDDDIPF